MSRADEESKGIDLGDKRAVSLAERLAQKPTASIPGAYRGWARLPAPYRLCAHDERDCREVLDPHWRCSGARMREHAIVLCIRDTSEGDFNGLGPLSWGAAGHARARPMR
jgi:hypothetical protein